MEGLAFKIFDMLATGQLTSMAIYIVAKLDIADYLKDGPKDIEELAKETKTNPNSLYRLLRMLASIGIFAEIDCNKTGLISRYQISKSSRT
jgi:DNA-binding HxlR family transcriptional regulator